jgi:hypothetical protein
VNALEAQLTQVGAELAGKREEDTNEKPRRSS